MEFCCVLGRFPCPLQRGRFCYGAGDKVILADQNQTANSILDLSQCAIVIPSYSNYIPYTNPIDYFRTNNNVENLMVIWLFIGGIFGWVYLFKLEKRIGQNESLFIPTRIMSQSASIHNDAANTSES